MSIGGGVPGIIGASGAFTALLPAGAVAGNRLPATACYISLDGITWLVVSDAFSTTSAFCGLTGIGGATPGLTIIQAPVGWFYYMIVVW
jgi:hypothetical protein